MDCIVKSNAIETSYDNLREATVINFKDCNLTEKNLDKNKGQHQQNSNDEEKDRQGHEFEDERGGGDQKKKKSNISMGFELFLSFLLLQAAIIFVLLALNELSAAASGMTVSLSSLLGRSSAESIPECRLQIAMAANKTESQMAMKVLSTRIDSMCTNHVHLPTLNEENDVANISSFLKAADAAVPTIIVSSENNFVNAVNITRSHFQQAFLEKSVALILFEQNACSISSASYLELLKIFKFVTVITTCPDVLRYHFPNFLSMTPSQFKMLDEDRSLLYDPRDSYLHRKDWMYQRTALPENDPFLDVMAKIERTPFLLREGVQMNTGDLRCGNAKVALCPGGYTSPEFWHAVDCGSIPVLHRNQSALIPVTTLPQNQPFIFVDSWETLGYLISSQFTRHFALDETAVNLELWKANMWNSADTSIKEMLHIIADDCHEP